MFTQRSSGHSKVVAFIVVLAMIMMYTFAFGGAVFAAGDGNDDMTVQFINNAQAGAIDIPETYDYVVVKVVFTDDELNEIEGRAFGTNPNEKIYKFDFEDESGNPVVLPGDVDDLTEIWITFVDGTPDLFDVER